METTIIRLTGKELFGSKAFTKKVEVGKWFKFNKISIGTEMIGYGKIVNVLNEEEVEVEKYFELPSYRPYAAQKWYDSLPYAI